MAERKEVLIIAFISEDSFISLWYIVSRWSSMMYTTLMKYDYFIASRWRNKNSVLELASKIRGKGKRVYAFIEGDGEIYELKDTEGKMEPEEFMQHFEKRDWKTDKAVREIFDVDMNALKESVSVILLLPAGKSAHMEIGAAYGFGKKTILIGEQTEAESSYCMFDTYYPTIDSFIDSL